MVTAIAVDPIPQGLFVHPDFPGGRRNRLGFLDHHPSDLFLVFRSERPALVRHGHPLFRERNLSGFPVRKIPGPSCRTAERRNSFSICRSSRLHIPGDATSKEEPVMARPQLGNLLLGSGQQRLGQLGIVAAVCAVVLSLATPAAATGASSSVTTVPVGAGPVAVATNPFTD